MKTVRDWRSDWLYQGYWFFCGWFRRLPRINWVLVCTVPSTYTALASPHHTVELNFNHQSAIILGTGYIPSARLFYLLTMRKCRCRQLTPNAPTIMLLRVPHERDVYEQP
ncbi:hypothetical protein F4677DRAFT_421377 [Hypoxylon crocopeplum]|nr:hypothetical protein F4677DRAFT_421377 [Hypoxylon crocopeplum]